jgi:tRNA modification GTPase
MPSHPTIFALSSGRLPAAIAVVRISGPRAGDALKALTGRIPEPRKAAFARVRDPATGELIDEALALWFPGPNSETGEDTAELQLHGGRAVLAATLRALSSLEGLRPAEAGEFTRRAFENGKLDLTAVEGLADLVGAETEAQRRQAFRQMQGVLAKRADAWREKLVQALALVEAGIDFSDEADVPADLTAPAAAIARELEAEISDALADGRRGERLREGLVVAIAGPPNAGKSTLLNRLARREAAIVSPHAGTTRDVIEVHLDLGGLPVTLLDTAGIRETDDPLELEGVRRARERAAAADLVLWLVDASEEEAGAAQAGAQAAGPGAGRPEAEQNAGSDVRDTPSRLGSGGSQPFGAPALWLIRNKADLLPGAGFSRPPSGKAIMHPAGVASVERKNAGSIFYTNNESTIQYIENRFTVSAVDGHGVDDLVDTLRSAAERMLGAAEPALVTRERHRLALEAARAALRRIVNGPLAEDLLAEELRLAARALARLTGRIDVEDVLELIFRDFCIGK